MKRHWVFALATLFAIPSLAHAQGDTGWGPRLRITPFVGFSPGIKQNGIATAYAGTTVSSHPYRLEQNSALPLGLEVAYRFWNRFGVTAEGIYAHRGTTTITDFEDDLVYPNLSGSDFWIAKLAPTVYLREDNPDMQLNRVNASVFVGPAYLRDNPKVDITTPPGASATVSQWGLNAGAAGELPLANNRLAFNLALEDFMIFWNNADYRMRIQPYLQENNPAIDAVLIDANKSNFWVLRAGLTFRF